VTRNKISVTRQISTRVRGVEIQSIVVNEVRRPQKIVCCRSTGYSPGRSFSLYPLHPLDPRFCRPCGWSKAENTFRKASWCQSPCLSWEKQVLCSFSLRPRQTATTAVKFSQRACCQISTSCLTTIFTARCYASAVLAMDLCLSVCPSQVGVLSKRVNESSWFLACELPSTHPTLC